MKRGWIALILLLLAAALSCVQHGYVTAVGNTCVEMLDSADDLMQNNEVKEAESLTERLDNRLTQSRRLMDVFLFHSDLDALCEEIAAMRRYAHAGETTEFLAASARAKKGFHALIKDESLRWGNVF